MTPRPGALVMDRETGALYRLIPVEPGRATDTKTAFVARFSSLVYSLPESALPFLEQVLVSVTEAKGES